MSGLGTAAGSAVAGGTVAGGAVASAIGAGLSWICCLPFVLGGLGVGSAAFATATAPMRPYLVFFSVALLGFAFYQAYRPATSTTGSAAGHVGGRRKRLRLVVWLAAGLITILVTVPYWLNWVIYWTL